MKKLLLSLSAIIAFEVAPQGCIAQCSELFFSEYVEGYNNNKALEIYNPTASAISLSIYRLVRWSNGSTTAEADFNYVQSLSDTIQPYSTFTFFLDKRNPAATGPDTILEASLLAIANNIVNAGNGAFYSPNYNANVEGAKMMPFNGDDALSLQKNISGNWTNVDIFAKIGEQPTNSSGTTSPTAGWTDTPPYNDGQGAYLTKDKTLLRKSTIASGVTSNPVSFNALSEWDSLSVGTYSNLGAHTSVCYVGIDENNLSGSLSVFPNPAEGIFTVYNTNEEMEHLYLYNSMGELVREMSTISSARVVIDLSLLPKGIYFLKAQGTNSVNVQKIVLR